MTPRSPSRSSSRRTRPRSGHRQEVALRESGRSTDRGLSGRRRSDIANGEPFRPSAAKSISPSLAMVGARKLMDKMTVRGARHDEVAFIVQMIRHMVVDMASYGGDTPATDDAAWKKIAVAIAGELQGNDVKYLVAESADGEPIGVAGAALTTLGGAFAPKKTLHISVVYVLPRLRRGGIAGRSQGCWNGAAPPDASCATSMSCPEIPRDRCMHDSAFRYRRSGWCAQPFRRDRDRDRRS
jgi:hypothetical protein